MMKPVYIASGCAISPQRSYEPELFLQPEIESSNNQLYVIDPDYRQYISPVAIRRMSRQLKTGITAGMRALEIAGIQTPDAIITGTGHGSMNDTQRFLKDMIAMDEAVLNPTYFIQSTYNSVNGWLAMLAKCTGYNQTYVNRGLSVEMSLLDAQMLLNEEHSIHTTLVGGFDEMTEEYFLVKNKIGYWKKELLRSHTLYEHSETPGTIAGEGAAFFVLSNERCGTCRLMGIKMIQEVNEKSLQAEIADYLATLGLLPADLDMIISGADGDNRHAGIYAAMEEMWDADTAIVRFKQWTGEYPTASGFALWLATRMMGGAEVPVWKQGSKPIRRIAVLNYYLLGTAGIMVLERTA